MLLVSLTVDNFGVFKGTHTFELAPRSESGRYHHLTIFSGHNGSGKSTLFQAIMLSLYGSLALGNPVTPRQYSSFISNHIHREPMETSDAPSRRSSSVKLRFQYVQSGQPLNVEVERQWQERGTEVQEKISILQNGNPPDIEPADYQVWLNDLIPPGFGYLCCFDAEQLDALVSTEQQNKVLRETLERLLGLDLVLRLQSDMEQYTLRNGGSTRIGQLYAKVLEARSEVDLVDNQLTQLRRELDEVTADLLNCEASLADQKLLLASEGGTYASRKDELEKQRQTIQKDIEAASNHIRDLLGELLPFAFAPELCLKLSKRLTEEVEIRRQQTLTTLWQKKLPTIEAVLLESEVWNELGINPSSKEIVIEKLMQVLRDVEAPDPSTKELPIYHLNHLAEPEYEKLQQWIMQVLQTIPQQIQDLGQQLRKLRKEQKHIETNINRVPDIETLLPIHNEIARLETTKSLKQRRQSALNEQIGSLQFQREEKRRTLQKALAQYEEVHRMEKQLILAERSKLVLRTYRDALTLQKLRILETLLVQSFNKICRKEYLLSKVHINPEDFSIVLKGTGGNALDLNHFSAGERQLYALALLWSLRQISGRQLPLAVDTPLARLDGIHRQHFIHDYVPNVSNQVLLFTTDAELDGSLLAEAEPYIAHLYRLQYDSLRGETTPLSKNSTSLENQDLSNTFLEGASVYGI